ncbi:hypothetical protein BU17DRAFT_94494 [Hysterangium stoloniferum]|nr:hypothetical protein BU17DRAFT_94494 [Hysterangium stoloniferum]
MNKLFGLLALVAIACPLILATPIQPENLTSRKQLLADTKGEKDGVGWFVAIPDLMEPAPDA